MSQMGLGCVKTRRRSIAVEGIIRPRPLWWPCLQDIAEGRACKEKAARRSAHLSPFFLTSASIQLQSAPFDWVLPPRDLVGDKFAEVLRLLRSGAIPVTPMSCIRALIAGVSMASCVTLLSLSTTGLGAPLGRKNAVQVVMSIPSNPCSSAVRSSGISGVRSCDSTAKTFSCLLAIRPAAAPGFAA